MAEDQIRRFERWRRRASGRTSSLIALVVDDIVPKFRAQGFDWFADYAGGSTSAVGPNTIPLQRRSGLEWPTVEITFDKRGRPALGVTFGSLPEMCCRITMSGVMEIPRIQACVVEGRAFFHLCKGRRGYNNCNFGYYYGSLMPDRKIRQEGAALANTLPWLFELFDRGIPQAWLEQQPGYVHEHAFLSPAARIFRHDHC
jgi:hypothetical protein